ncbi:hypothetical protein [Streptomyces sp. V4I23]|uniref:hypothetical protein n=1 Tax=Streptomyces sp. V4I23 TaxID=3042282 RepID=UPI0027D8FE10|nr:hypothetical protein [Streptomyces sp. V4I23]
MITIRLVGSRGTPAAPARLRELLTAHFAPADRIEHLWLRTSAGQIDMVLFILAGSEAEALLAAHAACGRALDRSPQLTAWRMHDTYH